MSDELKQKWDARYRDSATEPRPAAVLEQNIHLLPGAGVALDLACGLGGNAMLLAQHGLETQAWDLSAVAIDKLRVRALGLNNLQARVRDVQQQPPAAGQFDVIVISRFLQRALAPALVDALRPGGLLFYQTFCRTRVDGGGPADPAYRLADNELLRLFTLLQVVVYREEGRIGDLGRGFRNEAMLVGLKPGTKAGPRAAS